MNPKYERLGFAKYFGVYMADWRKEKDIRVHAFTASDANPALLRDSFKQINTRILTRVSMKVICGMLKYLSEEASTICPVALTLYKVLLDDHRLTTIKGRCI